MHVGSHIVSHAPPPRCQGGPKALEARLQPVRARLHQRLRLPLDRPQLRAAQALSFGADPNPSGGTGRLADVHVGLPPPGVPGGVEHLVAGSYDYYHYCQARPHATFFSDAGLHMLVVVVCAATRSHGLPTAHGSAMALVSTGQVRRRQVGLRLPLAADAVLLVPPAALHIRARAHACADPADAR